MKSKDTKERKVAGKSAWMSLLMVLIAALTLESSELIQYIFTRREIREKASMQAQSQLISIRDKIMIVIDRTENIVWNDLWMVQQYLDTPDSLEYASRRIVQDSPYVVGSTVALVPGYDPSYPLYSPYIFEDGDSLIFRSLATQAYDYPSQEWFTRPVESGTEYWSEPYFDEGGGDILMTTFSIPVKDAAGRTAAVFTADVSLDWLTAEVGSVQVYSDAFTMVVSRTGRIMVCPEETLVMRQTIQELAAQMDDPTPYLELNKKMLAGQTGNAVVKRSGSRHFVYYAPVKRTGWSMSIIIPEKSVYSGVQTIGLMAILMQLIGLAMLILILRSFYKSQYSFRQLKEKKEVMDRELQIASNIQMAMLPKVSQAVRERTDLDMAATLIPAKEVGGDLYDFFVRDDKLFFCIGDVSGKGIPASLVMAVTRAVFRTLSSHEDSPKKIMTAMNDSMSESNDSNMFVTIFCGALDLATGKLRFCNAGHNPPFFLSDDIKLLPVETNLPIGIVPGLDFKEQECTLAYDDALFLYTDGVSEAEDKDLHQFGLERIESALSGWKSSEAHLVNIKEEVSRFVGDAPQNDDQTMLFIHFLGKEKRTGKHLTLHNDIQQISLLPAFIDAVTDAELDPGTVANLNLALEEAVTNVILYAYPEGTEGLVNIDADWDGQTISFTISDKGKAFDPTAKAEVDITSGVAARPIGGLGIHLIRQIMDSAKYERRNGKNYFTITKKK